MITGVLLTLFLASMLSMAFMTSAKAQYVVDSYTAGLWHLDEGIGSVAEDASIYTNDGTLSGGKFGNALKFDGTDDYVDVGDIGVTGDWTVEFWVKLDTVTPIIQYPIGTGTGELYGAGMFVAFAWEGEKWGVYDGASYILGSAVSANVWYHVAVSKSGTTYTLYLNGNYENSGTLADVDITNLQIGRRIDSSGGVWYFDGIIDEVRISNIARTTFVLTVAPSVDANTVALWHFDESVDNIAYDSSGNNNHGAIYGAKWIGPVWTTGKFGQALSFDGVDDYVNIPDDPSLDITGDITLEAWVWIRGFSTSEGYHMYILSKDTTSQRSYGIGVDLVWMKPKKPYFIVFDGTTYKIAWGTTTLETETWYHIAGVFYASTGDLELYINGVLESTEPSTMTSIYSGTADLRIGARQYPGHRSFFNGIIDEVRISNVARTSFEWLPPIVNADFVLQDGTTLPVKFRVWSQGLAVTLTITGAGLPSSGVTYAIGDPTYTLRYDATEDYYIANFRTKDFTLTDGEEYTATVYIDGISMGSIFFDLYAAGKGAYRGNSGK